ncbi:hypothetical protein ACLQ3C_12915 [Gordonia sp. DT30]|uniref:hypothetical protein n=1 Tax=unclassified Gordonia (in: high G+C Gram-positive bacteria) TaxID=2657482 RepID=UPI003CE9C08B
MQPVEINAGTWYLRGLRADDRITDVPALSELGVADPAGYVAATDRAWLAESAFTWAVCEPTTGELLAVIGLVPEDGAATPVGRHRPGHHDAIAAAVGPVTRFACGALDLDVAAELVDALPTIEVD